jgi:hypothetical protein
MGSQNDKSDTMTDPTTPPLGLLVCKSSQGNIIDHGWNYLLPYGFAHRHGRHHQHYYQQQH